MCLLSVDLQNYNKFISKNQINKNIRRKKKSKHEFLNLKKETNTRLIISLSNVVKIASWLVKPYDFTSQLIYNI